MITDGILPMQGITYDTGGADIKYGGAMAGMHRDKCGAAFVAGFFRVCVFCHNLAKVKFRFFFAVCTARMTYSVSFVSYT